jgi:septum formation protein
VLASCSPRRAALLTEAGFEFETVSPRATERFDVDLTLRELTLWNAVRKGMSVAQIHPDKVILAADTLVAVDDQIIGKPADFNEATQMLRRLSGRTHQVCSAVFLYRQTTGKLAAFNEVSGVRFRPLIDAEIHDYLAKVNPLDKAGAYAAQASSSEIITKIDGSFTNVVGLPMQKTVAVLAEFGIQPKSR